MTKLYLWSLLMVELDNDRDLIMELTDGKWNHDHSKCEAIVADMVAAYPSCPDCGELKVECTC